MNRKELCSVIEKLDAGSNPESDEARKKIMDKCMPIIRAWADIYAEYGDYSISVDGLFGSSCNKVDSVTYDRDRDRLVFKCSGKDGSKDLIYAATDIVEPDFLVRKRKEIEYIAADDVRNEIAYHKKKIEELTERLELFANNDEYKKTIIK